MFLALYLVLCADPQIEVINRCPPVITVSNKCPAPVAAVKTGYPIRGSWWTHPGEIHAHLMTGEHRGKWSAEWVRSLTNAEAESLHSSDHEGTVDWRYVPGHSMDANGKSGPPNKTVVPKATPKAFYTPAAWCPTGT